MKENTPTEFHRIVCAGICPLQLGVVLVIIPIVLVDKKKH